MIEAIDAHIWWDPDTKRVLVTSFPSDVKGFLCDDGASRIRWRAKYSDAVVCVR